MPGHKDPEYEILRDEKGLAYVHTLEEVKIPKVVEPSVEVKPKESISIYNESELWDMNKKEQVDVLKKYGLKNPEIKKLNNEAKRVNKILSLQE